MAYVLDTELPHCSLCGAQRLMFVWCNVFLLVYLRAQTAKIDELSRSVGSLKEEKQLVFTIFVRA